VPDTTWLFSKARIQYQGGVVKGYAPPPFYPDCFSSHTHPPKKASPLYHLLTPQEEIW
jgi:hypothetical protein